MKYKYGTFTAKQVHDYKSSLHNKIHWLLIYKENDYKQLPEYFTYIQYHIAGLAELIESPQIINLATLIECARLESEKPNFDHKIYRKFILDAHSIIDSLPEKEGDINE